MTKLDTRWTGPIRAHDDVFIVVGAFRYALGRRSYAPGLVADWIEARKRDLPDEAVVQIAREIREAERQLNENEYRARWLSLAASLEQVCPSNPRSEEGK